MTSPIDCGSNRYARRLVLLGLLCGVLTIVSTLARRQGLIPPALAWLGALLPVLPMVGYFVGLGRWLRAMDEMQRLIHLEALFIQFGISALFVMGYGLLAQAAVVPDVPVGEAWPWLWLVLFASWAVGQLIVRRKYL